MPTDFSWALGQLLTFSMLAYGLTFFLKDAIITDPLRRILQRDGRYDRELSSWLEGGGADEDTFAEEVYQMGRLEAFFRKLFTCSFCTGMWSGVLLAVWQLYALGRDSWQYSLQTILALSLLAGVSSYIWDLLVQKLEGAI